MKKLLLLALATCLAFGVASAQTPDYFLWYGNPDGSDLTVTYDTPIIIPVYAQTPLGGDLDGDGVTDSVNFAHLPLASDDVYIASRDGGNLGYFPFGEGGPDCTNWDDVSFKAAEADVVIPGYTNQSIVGFAELSGPEPYACFLNTEGAQWHIADFAMTTAPGADYTCHTIFASGTDPANGGLLMGMQDGVTAIIPAETFSDICFTENTNPEWTVYPVDPCADADIEICFDLAGTDADVLDDLHITQTAGPGTYTEDVGGPGGVTSGEWCGTLPAGVHVLEFLLDDGSGGSVPLVVTVTASDMSLEIAEVNGFPGAEVWVPVFLHTCEFETGGFEILIGWDQTGLGLLQVVPAERIHYGNEYWNVNFGDDCEECPDESSARIVWIADINDGNDGPPAPAGDDPIFWMQFAVDPGLPWGMVLPVEFIGSHYSDNTISDESGYLFIHPLLDDGAVNVIDPDNYKGDPNMNGFKYEIADAVLVARRLIEGYIVWSENGTADDAIQESAGDLNNNGVVDIADLIRFINIINNNIDPPPRLDPALAVASVTMADVVGDNVEVRISSGLDIGGALVSINHTGIEFGTPVAANGMELRAHDADGVLNVVVFSLEGNTLAAGNSSLFTVPVVSNDGGSMEFAEASVADSYGRLLETTASLVAPLPTEFAVAPNYPNPFNAKTMISFDLPVASDVSVAIYNLTGQLVETLSGRYEAGSHSMTWDASNISSGVYFYKVVAGDFSQTRKMTLLK